MSTRVRPSLSLAKQLITVCFVIVSHSQCIHSLQFLVLFIWSVSAANDEGQNDSHDDSVAGYCLIYKMCIFRMFSNCNPILSLLYPAILRSIDSCHCHAISNGIPGFNKRNELSENSDLHFLCRGLWWLSLLSLSLVFFSSLIKIYMPHLVFLFR